MTGCIYLGTQTPGATDRIDRLRRHKIAVQTVEEIKDIPPETGPLILDGTAIAPDALDARVIELAARQVSVLALFSLPHGSAFRDRRDQLLTLGAADVMEAQAPDSDLITRIRALALGTQPPFVLVIEDNPKTGPWAVDALKAAGIDAECVTSLADARACFQSRTVDALIVDRNLPDGDGLDFVAFLRGNGIRTPALLFTAMDTVSDRISGLRMAGADDYICKPVHGDELVARVQVLLRPRYVDETLIFGPLELIRRDRIARWRGERIDLRPKECDMLIYLAVRQGLPIPKRMIYADVWDKVFMDVGSNPVTAARHRLVRDLKTFLADRGEPYPEFIATDGDAYLFRPDPLLQLPVKDTGP